MGRPCQDVGDGRLADKEGSWNKLLLEPEPDRGGRMREKEEDPAPSDGPCSSGGERGAFQNEAAGFRL